VHVPILGILKITKKHFYYKFNMKTPSIALLNSLGFTNKFQKVLFAAYLLEIANTPSPLVNVRAAKPAIPYKAAVPAFGGRAASSAIPASPSNPAVAAGALFPGSPALLAGASIPAFPIIPPVIGSPEVIAVPLVTALTVPAITPLKGWEDAVKLDFSSPQNCVVTAYLPYANAGKLVGISTTSYSILGITQPSIDVVEWLGMKASSVPETIISEPAILEQYLFEYASMLIVENPTGGTIENVIKTVNNAPLACKKITINAPLVGYDKTYEIINLSLIGVTR
jgi:hypothetical protein